MGAALPSMREANMKMTTAGLFTATVLLVSACGDSRGDQQNADGEGGVVREEILTMNALTMNALTMNALTMNALTMNALTMNALDPSALAAVVDPTATGALARELLKYVVSCAFDDTQTFDFTWTDGSNVVHNESYWGSLALDSKWSKHPLSVTGQEWVSACVLARVNWYGVSVPLSARGSLGGLKKETDSPELATYTREEGAFWGNIFASTPYAYSCNNVPNDSYSQSLLRDCAAGHLDAQNNLVDCGMIHRVGSCATYCSHHNKNTTDYYWKCETVPGGSNNKKDAVVTVFLQ